MNTQQLYPLLRKNAPYYADRKLFTYKTQLTDLREQYRLMEDEEERNKIKEEAEEVKTLIEYLK